MPGMPAFWAPAGPTQKADMGSRARARGCRKSSVLWLVAGSRAARSLLFFRVGFRAFWRARPPATKRCYLRCFVAFAFPAWLAGCFFWAAFFWSSARARDPMSAFWVGARMGPRKPASPALSGVKVGNMHNLTSHIIAHATFFMQKT